MPPKIVYGRKNKNTARLASVGYTAFLDPGSEALGPRIKTIGGKEDGDELAGLGERLGGLRIEEDGAKERRALGDCDGNVSRKSEGKEGKERKGDVPLNTPPQTPVAKSSKKKRAKPTTSKKTQLLTPEPTPERDDIYTQYVSPLLAYSDARRITTFEQWSSELEPLFEITKIAEASFSEVYRLSAISATTGLREESVLKVVALKSPPGEPLPCQNSERVVRELEKQMAKEQEIRDERNWYKSHVADVLSEVKLLQNLNYIPGFTNFRDLTVLQGRPSAAFNNAWKAWNKERPRGKKSYFADPSKKTSYEDTQLWAVVEMQDAGIDCEKLMEAEGLGTIWEIWDVFWGVCLSVAKAEEACQFEHRDLHMGNICIRSSRSSRNHVMQPTIKDPLRRKFRFSGLETTVIDYTLSRAAIVAHDRTPASPSSSAPPSFTAAEVAFLDLDKDPALFQGDAEEEYQYEIYRYMRGAALYNNPLQSAPSAPTTDPQPPTTTPQKNTHIRFGEIPETPQKPSPNNNDNEANGQEKANTWRTYHPKTNLVWTHYLLHKLLSHLKGYEPATLSTQDIMANVQLGSRGDPVPPAAALKVKNKAVELHGRLQRVAEMLCPVALGREGALGSVGGLVVWAVGEGWLRARDVSG